MYYVYLLKCSNNKTYIGCTNDLKDRIERHKSGNFQILIATGQLFGEGMDFSAFNCLFLVYPFSFEGKLIQYVGRIQRSKNKQVVYDYRDKNVTFLERLFQKRLKYYQKRGWVKN